MIIKHYPMKFGIPLFLLFSPFALHAAKGPSDTLEMKQLVLLQAQRMKSSIFEINGAVNVLGRKELMAPLARTLPEAMMGQTGLYVQRTNLGGGSVFMRGLTGNQILIMVDGIRMNNAIYRYGPNQYLNTLSIFDIHQVECYRGSGSVWYGSDALGGTMNIHTQSAQFSGKTRFKPNAQLRLETPSTSYSASAGAEYSNKSLALSVGGAIRNFGDVQAGKHMPIQSPSGYRENSEQFKLRYLHGKNEWIIAHKWLQQQDVPMFYRYRLESYLKYLTNQQGNSLNYLRHIHKAAPNLTRTITLAFGSQWEKRTYQKNLSEMLTRENDRVNSINLNAEWQKKYASNWQLVWCLEMYRDQVHSFRTKTDSTGRTAQLRGLYPQNASLINASAALMLRKNWRQWDFNAGIRTGINRLNFPKDINNMVDSIVLPSPPVVLKQGVYALSLNAGKKWNRANWFASMSSGYRCPNIDDMGTLGLVDFRYERPSYNLKPERNIMLESGLNFTAGKSQLSGSTYVNRIFGLISRNKVNGVFYQGYPVYEKVNSGMALVYGVEASGSVFIGKNLKMSLNGTWQKGDILQPKKEPMRRIPPLNGNYSLEWNRNSWNAGLQILASRKQTRLAPGDISDIRIGMNGTPAWLYVQCWVGKTFINGASISASIQNLTNAYYKTHGSGIWMPGRNFRILLSI
jgi:outer membrane cobalamin receptor